MSSELTDGCPNNTVIEMLSVLQLKKALSSTMVAVPDIPETDDKVPSWDGEIRLYSSAKSFSKENLVGRIPVQAKGKWVKGFSGKKANYQVSTSDLRNYLNDGGVMFFLIQSKDCDTYRIYYAALLPFDLRKLLVESREQKTKQIRLEEFPHKYRDGMVHILSDFLSNKKRQGKLLPDVFSLQDLKSKDIEIGSLEFMVSTNSNSEDELVKELLGHPHYLYAKPAGWDIQVPVDKVIIEQIVRSDEVPIVVQDEVLYNQVKLISLPKDERKYQLGKNITITLDTNKVTYNYTSNGTLNEQIRDLKFISALLNKQEIKVGSKLLPTTGSYNLFQHSSADVEQRLTSLLSAQETLKQLHVKKDLDLGRLTSDEVRLLDYLVIGIQENQAVPLSMNGQAGTGKLKIGNLVLLLTSVAQADGKGYYIKDFFATEGFKFVLEGCDPKEGIDVSPYMLVTSELYKTIDNIDLNAIVPAVKKYPISDIYRDRAILLALELLKIFDEEKDENVLDSVIQLLDYLQQSDDSQDELYRVNRLQTEKRRRALTAEEKQYLMTLKMPGISLQYQLAASILLESFQEAQIIYENMDIEERQAFDTYPIKNLWPVTENCR